MKKAFDIEMVKELANEDTMVTFGNHFPSFYIDNDLDETEWAKVKDFCEKHHLEISKDLHSVTGKRNDVLDFIDEYYDDIDGDEYYYFEIHE